MGVESRSGNRGIEQEAQTDSPADVQTAIEDGAAHETEKDGGLSEDDIFDVLRNRRRRMVISYLLEDGDASVTELAEHVATKEYDVGVDDITSQQYKRVYTALYQCHLQKLEDFDIIHFENDREVVTLDDVPSQLTAYLQRGGSDFAHLELTVVVIVAPLVVVGVLGLGPLGGISVVWWAVLTVLALVGLASLELYSAE